MDIFDLVATLSLDSSQYEQGLQGAESTASSIGGNIMSGLGKVGAGIGVAAGAAVAGVTAVSSALVGGITDLASYGDEIDKESQKLHMSAEGYQEWSAILEHSGSSISGLKMGMKTLTAELDKGMQAVNQFADDEADLARKLDEGAISQEEYDEQLEKLVISSYDQIDAFRKLGFSLDDVAVMAQNPEEAFGNIITALQEMDDETKRTALANDLLGRSAVELAPLLNTSAEETEAMRQRVHELGGVLSDESVKASASFQDQLQDMQTSMEGLKRNMLSDFLPSITEVMSGLTNIFAGDSEKGIEEISTGVSNVVEKISSKLPEILTVGTNIVMSIADAIIANAPTIIKAGIDVLKELALKLVSALPELVSTATDIITTVIDSLSETLPELIPKILSAIITLTQNLISNLPTILDSILGLVMMLVDGLLNEGLPMLLAALPDIINGITLFIMDSTPKILDSVVSIILAIANALPDIITAVIEIIPTLISSIITTILGNLPVFISAGIQLFVGLIGALPEIIAALVEAIPLIISAFVDAFSKQNPEMSKTGQVLFNNFIEGVKNFGNKIKDAIKLIWETVKSNIENHFSTIFEIGANILQGLIDGIKSKISAVTNVISDVAGKISDGFKDFFGIASPSKLFKEYGKFLDEGLAIGVKDNADMVADEIEKNFDFSDQLVDVTNSQNNATMNTGMAGNLMKTVIELLTELVNMDIVRLDPDEDYMYNIVRKKNLERIKITGVSGLV